MEGNEGGKIMATQPFDENKRPKTSGSLVILDAGKQIRTVKLSSFGKSTVTFGRNEENDICLQSDIVSGMHGVFEYINNKWFLTDEGSLNGTFVDGLKLYQPGERERSETVKLHDNAIIRVDKTYSEKDHAQGIIMIFTLYEDEGIWKRFNLSDTGKVTIGRGAENDIILSHPSVSQKHAIIENSGSHYTITDLESDNGVILNSCLLDKKTELHEKDVIDITVSKLIFTRSSVFYITASGGTRISLDKVSKKINRKFILQNVSLSLPPNSFTAIIGGSGTGKTTLKDIMCGADSKYSGSVLINGLDLKTNKKLLKKLIAEVPQSDIIHKDLILEEMMKYAASLRLPKLSKSERLKRIDNVIKMVGLEKEKDKKISQMSGGQQRRATLAAELLADAKILFLDEVTSGQDPVTEMELMKTFQSITRNKEVTVVLITHYIANLDYCSHIILMGAGGLLCFFGNKEEILSFFQVDSLSKVLEKVKEEPERWAKEFEKWRVK